MTVNWWISSPPLVCRRTESQAISLVRSTNISLVSLPVLRARRAGQFYTPAHVVKTLVAVLAPHKGRVYDPCCGSGGMFVQSERFIESHGGRRDDISIYGQESNPTTWRLAAMNLAIRGFAADLRTGTC